MQKTGLVGLFFLLKIYEFYSDISTQKKAWVWVFIFLGIWVWILVWVISDSLVGDFDKVSLK